MFESDHRLPTVGNKLVILVHVRDHLEHLVHAVAHQPLLTEHHHILVSHITALTQTPSLLMMKSVGEDKLSFR